jgi:hypothetical protein
MVCITSLQAYRQLLHRINQPQRLKTTRAKTIRRMNALERCNTRKVSEFKYSTRAAKETNSAGALQTLNAGVRM